jgi:4-hydroxy-tetrahydrodipicolinate reductase
MPAVNAIPNVVAAPPGIVTYTDLPLTLPRGWVQRGEEGQGARA